MADGLPNDHIFAVKADGPRVWIGTEDGLAMLDKRTGKIKSWGEKDGLPWRAITAIDVDKKTGDVWLGMFGGGLARFSGGRFDHWHQLNSGLVNDVVYGVAVQDEYVWAATTAGASRFNTVTGEWAIFTEKNSPMEEIWNYNVAVGKGKVYLAVWGSGMLEYDIANESLEGLPRSRRRDGDRSLSRRRHRPRHRHGRQPGRRRRVDLQLLRRLPLRRPALARILQPGLRPGQRLHQQHQGPQRGRGLVRHRQGRQRHHRISRPTPG